MSVAKIDKRPAFYLLKIAAGFTVCWMAVVIFSTGLIGYVQCC